MQLLIGGFHAAALRRERKSEGILSLRIATTN